MINKVKGIFNEHMKKNESPGRIRRTNKLEGKNSSGMMASGEKKEKSTPEILRMGKKRISGTWNNSRG